MIAVAKARIHKSSPERSSIPRRHRELGCKIQWAGDWRRAYDYGDPEAEVLAVDAHDWNGDEFAQGTWMAYRPGQVVKHASNLQQPQGRIAFAGDYMMPADGIDASESGRIAAATVRARLAV